MMRNRRAGPGATVSAAGQSREGKVVEVIYLPGATRDSGMVEVRMMAGNQQILARLAPSGFLHQNQMDIREGDTIGITGYWAADSGRDTMIATELAKQGKTLQLRDNWGRSAW